MKEIAYLMTVLLKKSYIVICVVLALLILVSMYASLHPAFIILEILFLFWTIAKISAVTRLLNDLDEIDKEIDNAALVEHLRKKAEERKSA